jgi:hypothetical protein
MHTSEVRSLAEINGSRSPQSAIPPQSGIREEPGPPPQPGFQEETGSPDMRESLLRLMAQLPDSPEVERLQGWLEQLEWLSSFHRCSRMLVAAINPMTLRLQYANAYFCELLGICDPATGQGTSEDMGSALNRLLSEEDSLAVQRLYGRHLLHGVFREFYGVDSRACRLLEAPALVVLQSPLYPEPRYVEFWLRSEQLTITRIDPTVDEFADLGLAEMSLEELETQLNNPDCLARFEQRLNLSNYQVQGRLLLEGFDMTVQETIRRITQLLIDRDSVLRPQKFQQVNQQVRSLFRSQNTVILTIEKEQIRVFMGTVKQELDAVVYPLEAVQQTHVMRAIESNQVITIADLSKDYKTDFGRQLVEQGIRSLLLIPLVSRSQGVHRADPLQPQVIGLVGLLSDRPNNFDGLDCVYAQQLIPAFTRALTSAQRQIVQQRFITNIHPAVEWRFMQEAERRSLGLPADPIVFNSVSPLYGISDIRGSSDARNRAIQADLLEQLDLGLAIVEAVCLSQDSALTEQLCLDLQERICNLQTKITVDAEVMETRYLRNHLEVYFDYFAQCGEGAIAAIQAYKDACNNQHKGIYRARADYDQLIGKINATLRETWEHWQSRMQQISPHYCDIETTDGIDHMIYAGQSIDPKFSAFQLRSLRYEQLRAVCDCARSALKFQSEYDSTLNVTHLVLVQDSTVDIFHDETTEKLFDVRGTRDTRYEIVKKRIDKAIDEQTQQRITQPGMLTLVYSTTDELDEYQQYLHYLTREGWVDSECDRGTVEPLQGVTGLKFIRVRILPG